MTLYYHHHNLFHLFSVFHIQKSCISCIYFQVFMTPEGKGWGLRTLEGLPKGAFICEYVGEVVTNMELFDRNKTNTGEKNTYPVLLDADWGTEGVLKDEEALCLDATFYGNVARFINHRFVEEFFCVFILMPFFIPWLEFG